MATEASVEQKSCCAAWPALLWLKGSSLVVSILLPTGSYELYIPCGSNLEGLMGDSPPTNYPPIHLQGRWGTMRLGLQVPTSLDLQALHMQKPALRRRRSGRLQQMNPESPQPPLWRESDSWLLHPEGPDKPQQRGHKPYPAMIARWYMDQKSFERVL